jgi:hypothetical protein
MSVVTVAEAETVPPRASVPVAVKVKAVGSPETGPVAVKDALAPAASVPVQVVPSGSGTKTVRAASPVLATVTW